MNENHSTIAETVLMEGSMCYQTQSSLQSFGVFHQYPHEILNPSFTGMIIWEIRPNHILNEYKLCLYHFIKSGIILYRNETFVFTPILNNNIKSFLQILLWGKNLPNGLSSLHVTKELV